MRKSNNTQTGRMEPKQSFAQRRRASLARAEVLMAEMDQEILNVNTLYEMYKQQFVQVKVANPQSPRLQALNIIVNKLAMAVNDCTAARKKIRSTARNLG